MTDVMDVLKSERAEYLGDSVYADVNEYFDLLLYTNNGFGPENVIVLEKPVIEALLRYIQIQKLMPDYSIKLRG